MWLIENLHAYVDKALHLEKIGVWCAVSQKQIVGSIFSKETIHTNIFIVPLFLNLLRF